MWRQLSCVILILSTGSAVQKVQYEGYQVYRIVPTTNKQLEELYNMEHSNMYDFWKGSSFAAGMPVDIMVSPLKLDNFYLTMQSHNMTPVRKIDNVQRLIDEEQKEQNNRAALDWSSYSTLEQIYSFLDSLETRYGRNIVRVVQAGLSYEGRPLKGVHITFPQTNTSSTSRKAIFIEGGIHAREWISPAVVTYMLDQILSNNNSQVRATVQQYDWHIFPVINPDGYKFTQLRNRLWRKNRQPWTKIPLLKLVCPGTDLNRNWGYHWGLNNGSSPIPCSQTFLGTAVFSAPEARKMADYISNIQSTLVAYLSFHSYGQYILLPYGDSNIPANNAPNMLNVANAAAIAIENRYGTNYQVGNNIKLLNYYVTGDSSDWVKFTFNTPIVLTFELRDKGEYGFLLPANRILPSGRETFDGLVTLTQRTAALGYI